MTLKRRTLRMTRRAPRVALLRNAIAWIIKSERQYRAMQTMVEARRFE